LFQHVFDKSVGYTEPYPDYHEALVVDNKDPDGLERLKVRVPEFHGVGTGQNDTPDDLLPWAAKLRLAFRGADVRDTDQGFSESSDIESDQPQDPGPPTSYGGTGSIPSPPVWPGSASEHLCDLPSIRPDKNTIPAGLFGVPRIGTRVLVIPRRYNINSLVWFLEPADGGSLLGIPNYPFTYGYVDENGNTAYIDTQDSSLNLVQFGDAYITITGNVCLTIGGNANIHIYGNANLTVDQNVNAQVGGNFTANIVGNSDTTVGGNQTSTVMGSSTNTVAGSQNNSVAGSQTNFVGGDQTSTVGGSQTSLIGGDQTAIVGGSQDAIVGGDSNQMIGGSANQFVGGDSNIATAGNTSLLTGGDLTTLTGTTTMLSAGPTVILGNPVYVGDWSLGGL